MSVLSQDLQLIQSYRVVARILDPGKGRRHTRAA